jgi:hypothetical protein
MPWVRIDENAMDHPKFVALSANAWRLWCEGMTYCQKHLTDGFMPRQGVKGMRYYSPAAVTLLLASLVPGKGPLWHDAEGGYKVHDYHDWNESRERVLEERRKAKERMDRLRGRSPICSAEQNTEQMGEPTVSTPHHVTSLPRSIERERTVVPDDPTAQVLWLQERYAQLHHEIIGVGYIGNGVSDYREWQGLNATFGPELLEKLMVYWFHMDDEFTRKGTRTVAKFRSRASKYAEELKAKRLA